MLVIADTSPISYLVLIGEQEILPVLFGRVLIPLTVFQELQATVAPPAVAQWIANCPNWLEVRAASHPPDSSLSHLDPGEREAILLAEELGADLLLMDEKAARKEAAQPQSSDQRHAWGSRSGSGERPRRFFRCVRAS